MSEQELKTTLELIALEKELIQNKAVGTLNQNALTEEYTPDEADADEVRGMISFWIGEVEAKRLSVSEDRYNRAKKALQ